MSDRRVVVDTCGWIEVAADGPLRSTFQPFLADLQKVVVPTIVSYECFRWGCREQSESWALELTGLLEQANVVPLSAAISLLAASLAGTYRLAMANAMIDATAQAEKIDLVTCDRHFAELPGVRYFPKSTS